MGFLSLPFGFLASPSYFALATTPIQILHQSCRPEDSRWNDSDNYSAFIYIDDGIFIGSVLGTRTTDCVATWEGIAKKISGQDCINTDMLESEGVWSTKALVLGFEIDTEEMIIRVPSAKVQGAADFILPDTFQEGVAPLTVKTLQVLRGLMTHWLNASLYWGVCTQAIDALLSHPDEMNEYIKCADPELVSAFWSMIAMLRYTAAEPTMWEKFV